MKQLYLRLKIKYFQLKMKLLAKRIYRIQEDYLAEREEQNAQERDNR